MVILIATAGSPPWCLRLAESSTLIDLSLLTEYANDPVGKPNITRSGRLTLPGHTAQAQPANPLSPAPLHQRRRVGKVLIPHLCDVRANDFQIRQTSDARITQCVCPFVLCALEGTNSTAAQQLRTPSIKHMDSSPSITSPTLLIGQRCEVPRQVASSKPPPNVGKRRRSHPDQHYTYNTRRSRSPREGRKPQGLAVNNSISDSPPSAQVITLVSPHKLPDRFRSIFDFPLFNAIQSQCYPIAYLNESNLVVSAPTGSGKTAILELAMCRLIVESDTNQSKMIYLAPTKSLCSERQRDWQQKFSTLGLECAELTGDTNNVHLRNVQGAHIIITTPEKWDSMTRKWKDHAKLMRMVKLVLIDEVHILKDIRGATLEAVVSRMQSIGTHVRFIALSATIPNSGDIALWLRKDSSNPHLPAACEVFGEDFRPVQLRKHVVGLPYKGNDFGFENACNPTYS